MLLLEDELDESGPSERSFRPMSPVPTKIEPADAGSGRPWAMDPGNAGCEFALDRPRDTRHGFENRREQQGKRHEKTRHDEHN
jgi:hypothetical protein